MRYYTRYVTIILLGNILSVLAFVLALHLLISIADKGTLDWSVLKPIFYELPYTIMLFFPIAILIGGLLGVTGMNNRNEITAMRASGMSRSEISRPFFAISVGAAIIMLIFMEFYLPKLYEDLNVNTRAGDQTLWQYQDDGFVRYRLNRNDKLRADYYGGVAGEPLEEVAKNTFLNQNGGFSVPVAQHWRFSENTETIITNDRRRLLDSIQPIDTEALIIPSNQLPYGNSIGMSLKAVITLKATDEPSEIMEQQLWQLILLPLTYLSVAMVVLPFSFSTARNARVGRRIFLGILIGLGFYMVSRMIGSLALVYPIPAWAAIGFTPLLLIMITAFILNRRI